MKASFFVNRLNKSGRYISALDDDKAFINKDNPKGQFKMVIEPIDGEIFYKKLDKGYQVEGEGYIITGSESEIAVKIRKNHSYKINDTRHIRQ